jgi:translation initiation factor 2B subunit (eIF-2B alpha/beta/delta family)
MELPLEIRNSIKEIENDHISGARTISINVVNCIDSYANWVLDNTAGITTDEYNKDLIELGQALIRSQPTMAPVINAVNTIITSIQEERKHLPAEVGQDIELQIKYLSKFTQSVARKYSLQSKLALEELAQRYNEILNDKNTIMTISSSSAVEQVLIQGASNSLELTVYVPESRPMNEGKLLAQRLADNGIRTILIADHAMFHFLEDCNSILVGADKVTVDGLVNKIGTSGLAIAANELKIPFYVATELNKLLSIGSSPQQTRFKLDQQQQPEEELYRTTKGEPKPDKFSIKNIYFDLTPLDYITGFLTEDGLLNSKQVLELITKIEILPELVI